MAAITIVSGRILLSTHENSVEEARLEMMPANLLQVSLHQADRLAARYAIEGDRSAPASFERLRDVVVGQFGKLAQTGARFGSMEHANSKISLPDTVKAWTDADAAVRLVFQHPAGTTDAIEALSRASAAIDSVYGAVSEFHHLSMQNLQDRLSFARTVVDAAYLAILGAILIGLVLLTALAVVVSRSILQPIAELLEAACKLGKKDFSHRIRLRNSTDELGQLGTAFNMMAAALQRLYQELERRSTYDGLTGALNRATFEERLSAECESADRHQRRVSLLMVDIDFFKGVNDGHGHQTGDRVLQAVARLLNEATRPEDVVARYGGEEFAIILPETDEEAATAMAERLRGVVENGSFDHAAGEDIGVTVSIGCASRRPHTMNPRNLIKSADEALYRAKEAGRNRVVLARKAPATRGAARHTAAA